MTPSITCVSQWKLSTNIQCQVAKYSISRICNSRMYIYTNYHSISKLPTLQVWLFWRLEPVLAACPYWHHQLLACLSGNRARTYNVKLQNTAYLKWIRNSRMYINTNYHSISKLLTWNTQQQINMHIDQNIPEFINTIKVSDTHYLPQKYSNI